MKISVIGKHLDLGDSLRSHVEDHVTKITQKYFEHVVDAHVTLEKDGYLITTAVEVHVGQGILVRANESATDPYVSVDMAIHKIERGLRRYKGRLKKHHTHHDVSKEERAMQYVLGRDLDEKEDHTEMQPAIIAETTAFIPMLTVSEAVMRMDLADLPVLLFRNRGHKGLNLVYVRKDGNIGWIDPDGNSNIHGKNNGPQ